MFVTLVALAAIPSASVALVVTRSAMHGLRSGVAVACGIVLGDLLFIALAVLGMSYLAETMGSLFALLRYCGGAYLIWSGFNMIRFSNRAFEQHTNTSKLSVFASFASGFLLTLGDIKAILFYASLLPAFLDVSNLSMGQIAQLGSIVIVAVGGVKLIYALASHKIASRIQNRKMQRITKSVAGCSMIGAGVYLIAKP
jgi:threonine/homoserine/homoserine lactone efflux protein